jgi:hypothetical protein
MGMDIPLCPHARPAWHYCPSCPQQINQVPVYIEQQPPEIPESSPTSDEPKPWKIVIEF